MHLVSDPDKFDEAMARKFPFFRTACGTAQPNKRLTKDPNLVTAPPDIPQSAPATEFELDDDLFDDLDDLDGLPSDAPSEPQGETPAEEPKEVSSGGGLDGLLVNLDQVADLVGMAMPMLGMVVGDCPTDPDWKKWVLDEHHDESFPAGSLNDIRVLLPKEDLSALRTLYGFGKDFGLDPLFGLLLSILHRQVVARAEEVPDPETPELEPSEAS